MSMDAIRSQWYKIQRWCSDRYVGWSDSLRHRPRWIRLILGALGAYLFIVLVLGIYWSLTPSYFAVVDNAAVRAEAHGGQVVTGSVTTATLIQIAETLLDKPGGFISNDIAPPGILMDNMPHWEYGVLIQVRDMSKAMREAFSRSQSQSTEDKDLSEVEPRFNFNNQSWILPASETQYEEALEYLNNYHRRLVDEDDNDGQFYARSDNLRYWLQTVETRLGSLSQRLSASVGQRRVNTNLAGDSAATQSTPVPNNIETKTPWLEIDDIFYEARGSSWAIVHLLKAIEVDFADILEKKNATVSLRQIIRELEASQETVYSPMILNGSGFGFVANHSLVMASYISRANAAIIDLRDLLSQG